MRVYLDESGCTGFKLDKPYLAGGSSQFLCLAFAFIPPECEKAPHLLISGLYKKYKWKNEKKASSASLHQKKEFAELVVQMKKAHPTAYIDCIIVKKQNVQPHIAADPNKIYNYMCKLVLVDRIKAIEEVEFIPDKRGVKMKSGMGLQPYLKTTLLFDCNSKTKLVFNPQESHCDYGLQFVDWIAHIVWVAYESGVKEPLDLLRPAINLRCLFFK